MEINTSIPEGAVAGEPDTGDDVSFQEAVLFAADVTGTLHLVFTEPSIGFAS